MSGKLFIAVTLWLVALLSVAGERDFSDTSGDILRVLIPAAAYSATFYNKDAKGRTQFYKSFALNAGVTYGLKETVVKERPDGSGNDSFPSGHASMAFQGAAFMQKRYGYKYGIPAYAAAVYTGWTRLESNEHSEIDVLAGAALGAVSSLIFTREYKNVTVSAALDNDYFGFDFSMKW